MLALRNAESAGDPSMILKFWFIVSGIYMWEFVTNLGYEWSVIRGHQRYRWSIWIYSGSRLSCLITIIISLANFSSISESKINCQAWATAGWTFSSLGCYCLSSILIMLRIFAIWERNKVILAISGTVWLVNLGFQLAGIIKIRGVWVPTTGTCGLVNIESCRFYFLNLLANDVILLLIMLAGLIRLRLRARAFLDIASVLWKQGVIWLLIATAAEIPQVLLLFLNLNDSFDFLFLLPSTITIVIAATRTYRALTLYAQTSSTTYPSRPESSNPQKSNRRWASGTKNSSIVHIPSNRLEVTVHRDYEEYPMSQMNRYHLEDAQMTDKTLELGSDDKVEDSDEKK